MKKFWVRRNKSIEHFGKYELYGKKSNIPTGDYIESILNNDFERLTGLKLKPGEIVQCELKVIKKG